jgi:hypothetical protein
MAARFRNRPHSLRPVTPTLVAGFAKYFGTSPENLDIEAVRQYRLYLSREHFLCLSVSFNQLQAFTSESPKSLLYR